MILRAITLNFTQGSPSDGPCMIVRQVQKQILYYETVTICVTTTFEESNSSSDFRSVGLIMTSRILGVFECVDRIDTIGASTYKVRVFKRAFVHGSRVGRDIGFRDCD